MSDLGVSLVKRFTVAATGLHQCSLASDERWLEMEKVMTTTSPETSPEVRELRDEELENVFGGKASFNDISFTHKLDKASPVLFQA
jgi:type VI protein secretion system component Hcp